MEFDPTAKNFSCPACQGNCTCDVCTVKRGEVYVPIRRARGTASGRGKARGRGAASRPSLPPLRQTVVGPTTTYWATVYGFSGEKLATAFIGDDGNDQVVVARPVERPRTRVFVGDIQPSWHLGDFPIIKDVDPLPAPRGKGKGRASDVRIYVGDKVPLFLQLKKAVVQTGSSSEDSHSRPAPKSQPPSQSTMNDMYSELECSSVLTPLTTSTDLPPGAAQSSLIHPASNGTQLSGADEHYTSTLDIGLGLQATCEDEKHGVQSSSFKEEKDGDVALRLETEIQGATAAVDFVPMSPEDLAKAVGLGLAHIGVNVKFDSSLS